MKWARVALVCCAAVASAKTAAAQTRDGAAIFARDCASCHTGAADSRAPSPDILKRRSPEAILSALTAGGMRPQGGRLSGAERRAVAEYLSGKAFGTDSTGARIGRCTSAPPLADPATAPGWLDMNGVYMMMCNRCYGEGKLPGTVCRECTGKCILRDK